MRPCLPIASMLLAALLLAQEDQLAQRFAQLDANDDGRLSAEEVPWPQFFERADADGDGFVTLEEARAAMAGEDRLATVPEGVTKHADIPYAQMEKADPLRLSLDMYQPDGAVNAPVMLHVDGGGWQRGDKRAVARKPEFFCGMDWVLASANYRFVPEVTPADQVRDIARAITWPHQHAAEYDGDPERIFLSGHSAGAHLVALVSTDPEPLEEVRLELSALSGTIVIDTGTLDLVSYMGGAGGQGIFANAFGTDPEFWRSVSPLEHVTPDTGIPPFLLLIQGNETRLARARRFADALVAAGTQAQVVYLPEHDHGSINQSIGHPGDPTTEAMLSFLGDIYSGHQE